MKIHPTSFILVTDMGHTILRNVFSVIGTMFQIRSSNYVKEFLWQIYVTDGWCLLKKRGYLFILKTCYATTYTNNELLSKTKISSFSSVSILPEAIFGLSVLFLLILLMF